MFMVPQSSDNSDSSSRSARISLLQFSQALGICGGYLLGELLFSIYGYGMVFAVTIAVHVFAILYACMRLPWDFKVDSITHSSNSGGFSVVR